MLVESVFETSLFHLCIVNGSGYIVPCRLNLWYCRLCGKLWEVKSNSNFKLNRSIYFQCNLF